jgi:hypothetical protein
MVILSQNPPRTKTSEFDFSDSDTKIRLIRYKNFFVMTNSCRIKAIKGIENLPIKERFGIDDWAKWIKLKDCLTQEQVEELWLTTTNDPDFVLSGEDLKLFIF